MNTTQSRWGTIQGRNITVVGDSTSHGFYNNVVFGVFRGQAMPQFKFIRHNQSPWYPTLAQVAFEDIIIINFGAHEAKSARYVCPVTKLDYVQRYEVEKNVFKNRLMPNETFESASTKSLLYRTPACLAKCNTLALASWRKIQDTLRHIRNYSNATILFRSIQINFGFDRRGLENCIKMQLNNLLRDHANDNFYTFVDITKMVSAKQEEYIHENTNHFYCECVRMAGWCNACNKRHSVHQRFTEYILDQASIALRQSPQSLSLVPKRTK